MAQEKPQKDDQPDDTAQQTAQQTGSDVGADPEKADGFTVLRQEHAGLRALLGECESLRDSEHAEDVLSRLTQAWAKHSEAHQILHEAALTKGLQEFPLLTELAIETDLVSFLLLRANRIIPQPLELAAVRVAARLIGEIIEREEKPRSGLFARIKAAGVEPDALGGRIRACITALSDQDGEPKPQLRHLKLNQEDIMPRNSNMPERDERGRFVSDDDYGDRDYGGRGRGHRGEDQDRDSRGRFTSDRDDDRRGSSRSRREDDREYAARGYDDERRYSRRRNDDDRGQGGWFGDAEGHAEASRRGWDRRRDEDDDDRRYASRGRYADEDRDYARDRGQGGWFGDAEGHAEASRRGWDRRRDEDDDDRRYASRGRYADDDRGYSRDRGPRGWYGDAEGHAEASRRGWDRRRDDDDDDRRYASRGRR